VNSCGGAPYEEDNSSPSLDTQPTRIQRAHTISSVRMHHGYQTAGSRLGKDNVFSSEDVETSVHSPVLQREASDSVFFVGSSRDGGCLSTNSSNGSARLSGTHGTHDNEECHSSRISRETPTIIEDTGLEYNDDENDSSNYNWSAPQVHAPKNPCLETVEGEESIKPPSLARTDVDTIKSTEQDSLQTESSEGLYTINLTSSDMQSVISQITNNSDMYRYISPCSKDGIGVTLEESTNKSTPSILRSEILSLLERVDLPVDVEEVTIHSEEYSLKALKDHSVLEVKCPGCETRLFYSAKISFIICKLCKKVIWALDFNNPGHPGKLQAGPGLVMGEHLDSIMKCFTESNKNMHKKAGLRKTLSKRFSSKNFFFRGSTKK